MAGNDLIFRGRLITTQPVRLVFGEAWTGDQFGSLGASLAVQATMTGLTIAPTIDGSLAASLTLSAAMAGESIPSTTSAMTAQARSGWGEASRRSRQAGVSIGQAARAGRQFGLRLRDASPRHRQAGERWQESTRRPLHDVAAAWEAATALASVARTGVWQETTPVRRLFEGAWQAAVPHLVPGFVVPWGAGRSAALQIELRWDEAGLPNPGVTARPPRPVDPPPHVCYVPPPGSAVVLAFKQAASVNGGRLVFACGDRLPPAAVLVPIRRVYMVTNNVSLIRLTDGMPVPVLAASLRIDVDSWAWGFQATVPGTSMALIEPGEDGPVVLLATVNGTPFQVLVEQVSRDRSFNQSAIRISGRSRNAVLDAPYAPIQNFINGGARTSQQLMDDVLTANGISLGWGVEWGLEAWNVPAGVFSHQGSYISALLAIAQAGGGYLLPHADAKSFKVQPRYPVAPWSWGDVTPDFELPSSVVTRESMAWKEKPAYNRVYVSGQAQGVLGRVTRAGTAGDIVAPMVVDQLITTAAAARQRGLPVLADTGRQVDVGLSLPVLAETGIILPGAFVRYQDGSATRLGLVRSVDIECNFPVVRQTLGVETHA